MAQSNNEQARTAAEVDEVVANAVNIWCKYHNCYFIGTPGTFPTSRAHIRSLAYRSLYYQQQPQQALAGTNFTIIRPIRPQLASSFPRPQQQITQTNSQPNNS